jgi:hypothetical protein
MKNISAPQRNTSVVPQHRSFRRLIKKMFAGLLKRQNSDYQDEVIQRLQNLENKIERMARAMSQQGKRGR